MLSGTGYPTAFDASLPDRRYRQIISWEACCSHDFSQLIQRYQALRHCVHRWQNGKLFRQWFALSALNRQIDAGQTIDTARTPRFKSSSYFNNPTCYCQHIVVMKQLRLLMLRTRHAADTDQLRFSGAICLLFIGHPNHISVQRAARSMASSSSLNITAVCSDHNHNFDLIAG